MKLALSSIAIFTVLLVAPLHAQTPQQLVKSAVENELAADRADTSNWIYRDRDLTPEHDTLTLVVETPAGSIKRKLADHGHPLSPAEAQAETARIQAFAADRTRQLRAKRDSKHDDDEAEEMLKLLPVAFLWTIQSQTPDLLTLTFKPNPAFTPHTLEARVLSNMAGRIVVYRPQNRIQSIHGALTTDVTFGWGILGRLHQGGSFQVDRRQVAPGLWQVTESHIHIDGRALFFKNIGEQEDETKTDFRRSYATTIPEAAAELK